MEPFTVLKNPKSWIFESFETLTIFDSVQVGLELVLTCYHEGNLFSIKHLQSALQMAMIFDLIYVSNFKYIILT
jgi:hypothetical protein